MVLKDCSKGRIYAPGENRFWACRVDYSEEKITLYIENYEGHGQQFGTRVDFFDDVVGVVVTDAEVRIRKNPSYPEQPEYWIGDCVIRNVDTIVQRHLDVRVNVDLSIQFQKEEGRFFIGNIRNISAGGIYVVTKEPLSLGELVKFSYTFHNREYPYSARVLWGQGEKDGFFGYGCRFVDMTNGEESAVRSYVFGKMREQVQIEKQRSGGSDSEWTDRRSGIRV